MMRHPPPITGGVGLVERPTEPHIHGVPHIEGGAAARGEAGVYEATVGEGTGGASSVF